MNTDPNSSAQDPGQTAPAPDQSTDWHRPMLKRLAMGAMNIADATEQQALRQAQSDEPNPAPAILYTRLMRAIRQCIALDKRLAETTHAQSHANAQTSKAEQARRTASENQRKRTARNKIRRKLLDTIDPDLDQRDRESLLSDLEDRLAADDIDALLLTRGANDLVLDLCEELGIDYTLAHWTDEEIEQSCGPFDHAKPRRDAQSGAANRPFHDVDDDDEEDAPPKPVHDPPS